MMVMTKKNHKQHMTLPYFLLSCLSVVTITGLIKQSNATVYQEYLNIQELEFLFSENDCIDGTISVSETGPTVQSVVFTEPITKSKINSAFENEGKSPMSRINELALFNNIPYNYTLIGDEGPAHNKQFTVSLQLGKEKYVGEGSNIKHAQHSAARLALETTQYNHMPIKAVTNQLHKTKSPLQQLEKFVAKRWAVDVDYIFDEMPSTKECSGYQENHCHKKMYLEQPFHKVTIEIGHLSFVGEGLNPSIAKENAAKNALEELKRIDEVCSFQLGREHVWNSVRDCPISLVNEFASISKLKVSFVESGEEGPGHMKMFTIKCSISDKFESYGKGPNKKSAKKEAALNMLKKLKTHDNTDDKNCNGLVRKNKRKKQKTKSIVKDVTNVPSDDKTSHSFLYDINPVSKLMQIQQSSFDMLPIFRVLEEKSNSDNQYFVEVKVGDSIYVGSGPSKKIAKRRAAEGMLHNLGYSGASEEMKVSLLQQKRQKFSNKLTTSKQKPILTSGTNLNSKKFYKLNENEQSTSSKSESSNEIKRKEKKESNSVGQDSSAASKNKIKPSDFKLPMSQLDDVSQTMGFRFQFSDFIQKNNSGFITLLSLTTQPPKVCLGTGVTLEIAQDIAVKLALSYLYENQLMNSIPEILEEITLDTVPKSFFKLVDKTIQEKTITDLKKE